jgi:hypothetical protein
MCQLEEVLEIGATLEESLERQDTYKHHRETQTALVEVNVAVTLVSVNSVAATAVSATTATVATAASTDHDVVTGTTAAVVTLLVTILLLLLLSPVSVRMFRDSLPRRSF